MGEITETEALVALSTLGPQKLRKLLRYYGSASAAFDAPIPQIEQIQGIDITSLKRNDLWRKELDLIEAHHVKLIPFTSASYPKKLLEVEDYPPLIYLKGEWKPQDAHNIAIIGTRDPTPYGQKMAESFGCDLASLGFTIISGLARGIDTTAHRGALKKGRTIAVIGSGLAHIYPPENSDLAQEIAQQGAIISEFSMQTPPEKQHFPMRNRIVSGLSQGVLLIEAPLKSGAMITMDFAKRHRRRRYAIPGRVDIESFRGNHFLIKEGVQLVECAFDIANSFDLLFQNVENRKHREISEKQ